MLPAEGASKRRARALPVRDDGTEWHPGVLAWWKDIWRSPMASELLKADIHELYQLAELKHQFALKPTTALAAEIRLQRQCFGLTPLDRRRLEWSVAQAEEATERRQQKRRPADVYKPVAATDDPRSILRVVQ